jgi:hypothetical protein
MKSSRFINPDGTIRPSERLLSAHGTPIPGGKSIGVILLPHTLSGVLSKGFHVVVVFCNCCRYQTLPWGLPPVCRFLADAACLLLPPSLSYQRIISRQIQPMSCLLAQAISSSTLAPLRRRACHRLPIYVTLTSTSPTTIVIMVL